MRLAEALEQAPTGALRRIASAHALAHDDGTTRDELIARIAERLGDATYLSEQLAALPEDDRAVLASARLSSGELRGFLVDLEYPGAAESLAERGWLYRVFAAAGPLRGEVFVLPDELQSVLPEPQRAESLDANEPPPAERRSSDPAFSLFALVSALTRVGGRLEDEVRPWSEEPGGWAWDARWTFLQHLATAAGVLTHRADGKLAPAATLPRLLDDPTRLSDRLWRTYVGDATWSELAQAGFEDGADLADTLALRRAVVDAFEQLPENRWMALDEFSSWLQRTRPSLVREQLNPRGLVRLQAAGWSKLEQLLLRTFVLGPLYWLGMVSASRDGQHIARRSRASGVTATDSARGPEPCRWDTGAELVAPPRSQLGTLLLGERYLVLRERGRLSRYHLVQAHMAAALSAGGSFDECRQLLARLCQSPLPADIEERVVAWAQRFGALELRPTVVLEARSPAELDAAIADELARPFVRARLGPTAAEVAAADALELAAALRQSGHLPRVDAALRLAAEPRRAYASLVDEQVLEFLLVSLLAFRTAWPERLAELEGSQALLERLERQFPPDRLAELRLAANRLSGALSSAPPPTATRLRSQQNRGSRRPRRRG